MATWFRRNLASTELGEGLVVGKRRVGSAEDGVSDAAGVRGVGLDMVVRDGVHKGVEAALEVEHGGAVAVELDVEVSARGGERMALACSATPELFGGAGSVEVPAGLLGADATHAREVVSGGVAAGQV